MNLDSFDADPPHECDDEYWECPDPAGAFKQPDGIPCSFTMFRLVFELLQIASFGQRAMVSSSESLRGRIWLIDDQLNTQGHRHEALGATDNWEQHMVKETQSAMERWRARIPDYRAFCLILIFA
jgi:hypothetical protein